MGHQSSKVTDSEIQEIKERVDAEHKEYTEQRERKAALTVLDKLGHIEDFNKLKNKITWLNNRYDSGIFADSWEMGEFIWFINKNDSKQYEWLKGPDLVALNIIANKWPELQFIYDKMPDNSSRAFLRQAFQDAVNQLATVSLYRFPYY